MLAGLPSSHFFEQSYKPERQTGEGYGTTREGNAKKGI